jgi:hypothetical protein
MDPQINIRAAGPDWQSIGEEILCPLCEYDLQGLSEPRCPECGYTFEWQDLIDPTRRLHRYVFEHHPERNVSSFWQTTSGILRPRRFWRSLQPVQPSNPRRLVLYWLLAMLLAYGLFEVVTGGCIMYFNGWLNFAANRAQQASQLAAMKALPATDTHRVWLIQQFGSIENALERWYPTHLSWNLVRRILDTLGPLLGLPLLLVFWPWAMFATLMIFRWSMRRARIRAIHVLRCCIYTSGTAVWITLTAPLFVGGGVLLVSTGVLVPDTVMSFVFPWIVVGWVLLMLYQLSTAYRLYLRFDHSFATVFCAQVVAALAVVTAFVVTWVILYC